MFVLDECDIGIAPICTSRKRGGFMDKKTIEWSKTILISQAIVPRLLDAINSESEQMLNIGYGSQHYRMGQNTYDFLDRILQASIRKRNLTNVYYVVEDILKEMDDTERKLLLSRFRLKKCVDELMPKMNIRTVYRHYNNALQHFGRELNRRGYSVDKLEELFGEDRVISAIHEAVVKKSIRFTKDSPQEADAKANTKVYEVKVYANNYERLSRNMRKLIDEGIRLAAAC